MIKTKHFAIVMTWGLLGLALLWLPVLSGAEGPVLSGAEGPVLSGAEGLTLPASAAPADTLTVCPAGPPDCQYTSIQAAVDAASAGDVVKVATGVYTDVHGRPAPSGYPNPPASGVISQVVYLDKGVILRGGYTAPGFAEPPDPDANPTTLDAQGQGRVIYVTGDIEVMIEGLGITGGDADGLDGPAYYASAGGGVYAITATVTIQTCKIFSNTAWSGGGLALAYNDATLRENIIITNSVGGEGGGLFLYGSNLTFESNKVTDNLSNRAGGLYLCGAVAVLDENIIADNNGGSGGGGALALWCQSEATITGNTISGNGAADGGGLYLREDSSAVLRWNTIRDNLAFRGGGLHIFEGSIMLTTNVISGNISYDKGGGLYIYDSIATLNGNTIIGNATDQKGGGLYQSSGQVTLNGNTISGNQAGYSGGGAHLEGLATLEQNTITENMAEYGGGVWGGVGSGSSFINNIIADNQATKGGSGLYLSGSPQLMHNTIARNYGGNGRGVWVSSGNPVFTNTILVSHTVGVYAEGGTTTLEATLWGADTWANGTDWAGSGVILTGTVNVWGAPGFADPDAGDYHIGPGSAALDAGVDAGVLTDIDHQPRPYLAPDLGADEYWPPGALHQFYLPLVLKNR